MATRFRKRYVEDPNGLRWVVERHWLARRPKYFGYRFRRPKPVQEFEPPLDPLPEIHRPPPNPIQPPLPRHYQDSGELARRDWGGGWIFWGRGGGWGWGSSSGRSSGGGGWGIPSSRGSGGSRSSGGSGGRRSGGGSGGSRGGGGGAAASGAAGLLAVLAKALLYIAIAIAIAVAAALIVFVLFPGLVFIAQLALFWILVGGWIVFNTLTGRPWIIRVTQYEYEKEEWAFRVKGWRNSQLVIDDLADDLRRGEAPIPSEGAVEVELIQD